MRIVRSVALAVVAILGLLAGTTSVAFADDGLRGAHETGPAIGYSGAEASPGDTGDGPPGP